MWRRRTWTRCGGAWVCAPHFSILGAPKTGTTSLYKYLGEHARVRLATEKELFFWGWPFQPGRKLFNSKVEKSYLPNFPHIVGSAAVPREAPAITGEASPMYLYCDYAALNLKRYARARARAPPAGGGRG